MQIAQAVFIYLLVPLTGLLTFLYLNRKMRRDLGEQAPTPALFSLFFTYGGWLMVFLTLAIREWSGAAILGLFYLVIIAPMVLGFFLVQSSKAPRISSYHRGVFYASVAYYPFLVLIVSSFYLWAYYTQPK